MSENCPVNNTSRRRSQSSGGVIAEWVAVADISPLAFALYARTAMAATGLCTGADPQPADWTLDELTLMMRALVHEIDAWLDELEAIGAIDVTRFAPLTSSEPPTFHRLITFHEQPPPGYTGPMTLEQWRERT